MLSNVSELLKGISALLWPVIVLLALFFFRSEISGFLTRVRKARVFGQEVELDRDLDDLAKSAEQLEERVTYSEAPPSDGAAHSSVGVATNVQPHAHAARCVVTQFVTLPSWQGRRSQRSRVRRSLRAGNLRQPRIVG